jgi:hypothetical protein
MENFAPVVASSGTTALPNFMKTRHLIKKLFGQTYEDGTKRLAFLMKQRK